MKKVASVLLGSGFSRPEGLPSVADINQRMSRISEEEIIIHSSQHAMFLNGLVDLNRWDRRIERCFVQEFLEFYCNEILVSEQEFNYEEFYDYYSLYPNDSLNRVSIENFMVRFASKYIEQFPSNFTNRLAEFNRTFNQLLALQLHRIKYLTDPVSKEPTRYDEFLRFLSQLVGTYNVKVHTLNHDLLFEWLIRQSSIPSEMLSDGFDVVGSPYYGRRWEEEMIGSGHLIERNIKLARFTGEFNKPISLYKLHGSINYRKLLTDGGLIRIRAEYGFGEYWKEIIDNETTEQTFEGVIDEVYPDFLSGTTNKIRYYSKDSFYRVLFDGFVNNLISSDILLVIGYGFCDGGINTYVKENYLQSGKRMIVIDPVKPKNELLEFPNSIYIQGGITDFSHEQLTNLVAVNN